MITPASNYTLDSRITEGITNLESTALGVSLDSRPTEGASCLEPLDQSVLSSSLAVRPVEGITKKVSDWKPVINLVISYTLDSQLMEGIIYLECSALGVSLDSRPTEGVPCLEPLEQSVLSLSLAARPVEGVAEKVSDRKPVINPVQNINPYGRPMEGIAYPEHLAPAVSLDSRFCMEMLQAKPLPTLVHTISLVARPQLKFRTSHWKTVINPVLDINTVCLHVRRFLCPALLEQSVLGVSPEIRTDQTDGLQCPSWTTQLHCEQSGLQSSAWTLLKMELVDDYDSPDRLQTEISVTSTEMTGGSPPADIDICDCPDRLQIEISATSTKMTGGSPPAEIGISKSPDKLQTEISETSMEMGGGSPPALVDICEGPDRIQTEISVTSHATMT